jgi:trimeric autotransporter adhesin
MLKKIIISLLFLLPLTASAQVFTQGQIANPPYLNGGIPYSTSSATSSKFSVISTSTLASLLNIFNTVINGVTGPNITFATGTAGTNFGIATTTGTVTFNLPDASASNRGALTAANFTIFNNKVSTGANSSLTNLTGLTGGIQSPTFLTFTGTSSPAYTAGRLVYDTFNEALTFFNNDSAVGMQIGQEQWIRARNVSGSTILNGSVVYISGASSTLPTITLARADAKSTNIIAGVATQDILNNAIGHVTYFGFVRNLNTSIYATGTPLYLSATTAGALATTTPVSPNYSVYIGKVINVSTTVGMIMVQPGTPIIGDGTAGQVLWMDPTTGRQAFTSTSSLAITGGATTSPAGSTGLVQFNTGGFFDAISSFFFDKTNSSLQIGTSTAATTNGLYVTKTTTANPSVTVAGQATSSVSLITLTDLTTSGNTANWYIQPLAGAGSNILTIPLSSGIQLGTGATGGFFFNARATGAPVGFATGGNGLANIRMLIGSNGNIGVGFGSTSTPADLFHINGTLRVNGAFKDSVNATGTSGQVLSSSGSATTWATIAPTVASANGFAGSFTTGLTSQLTLTTSITGLLKGNGTSISAASAGTDYENPLTFSAPLSRSVNTVSYMSHWKPNDHSFR